MANDDIRNMLGKAKDKMNINKTDSEKKIENLENDVSILKSNIMEMKEREEDFKNMIKELETFKDMYKDLTEYHEQFINLFGNPERIGKRFQARGTDTTSLQLYLDKVMEKIIDRIIEESKELRLSRSNLCQRLIDSLISKYNFDENSTQQKKWIIDNIYDNGTNFDEIINEYKSKNTYFNYKNTETEINVGPYSGEGSGKKISAVIESSNKKMLKRIMDESEYKGGANKLGQLMLKKFILENDYIIDIALFDKELPKDLKETLLDNIEKLDIRKSRN